MGVGQLSESDAVDALRLPFYSSSHPTGSHGWRNQFDLGNPDQDNPAQERGCEISFADGCLRITFWGIKDKGCVIIDGDLEVTGHIKSTAI